MNDNNLLTTLKLQSHAEQAPEWPTSGRHILAQFDSESIVVYQAYRPAIADYAVKHQRFGGEFSFNRMSWIKPNFLWMMFRAGWATKEGQERILAVRIRRPFFDEILAGAVASSFGASGFHSQEEWKAALAASDVRLQWDPDHDPKGNCLQRRAVQLGLRGVMLRRYGTDEVIGVEDITPFVAEQREHVESRSELLVPVERVYVPDRSDAITAVALDSFAPRAADEIENQPQGGGASNIKP